MPDLAIVVTVNRLYFHCAKCMIRSGLWHPEGWPSTDHLPSLAETIDLTVRLGRRTNPAIRCAGVSLNTAQLEANAARELLARETQRLGLPAADPIRRGPEFEQLVDSCLA